MPSLFFVTLPACTSLPLPPSILLTSAGCRCALTIRCWLYPVATLAGCVYKSQTPLFQAAERGHLEVVKLLLAANAAVYTDARKHKQVDPPRSGVFTLMGNENCALTSAVHGGHVEVVKELLACGASLKVKPVRVCGALFLNH